jgi:S1/P1 Nuclease
MLFMLAPRWADDIRRDNAQHRGPWHYINFSFKPDGQPASAQTKPPQAVNIITALVDNERIVKTDTDPARKSIALTWLFHLVGDIHQPLHSVQFFTTDYPNGDEGGNQICVRPGETSKPMNLHQFWDGLLTSTNNVRTLRNMARELRNRFPKSGLTELVSVDPQAWAKESFEIATKIAYQNGALRGTPKGQHKECGEVGEATVRPHGYAAMASQIADRRVILAGYRIVELVDRVSGH